MSEKLLVRRAAVLGAGVMGAQIAAHLTNAGIDTVLFDLPAKEGPADGVVLKAIANLGKLSPAPLASKSLAAAITPANYELGLQRLDPARGLDIVGVGGDGLPVGRGERLGAVHGGILGRWCARRSWDPAQKNAPPLAGPAGA